jgi:LPXTG-motif cell wall-anchored protein
MTELTGGVYQMDNLLYGSYFVKEKTAPEGYVLDENAYAFSVAENGKTVTVENEAGKGCYVNEAQKGTLKIVKTSSDGKVEGFSFKVTGPSGYAQTFVTDKNGEILIENLRIGEYTVSEVGNDASAAYTLPADKQATVQVGATTIVQMHNDLKPVTPDIPKTGDTTNVGLWAALCLASLAGVGVTAFVGFRRKKNSKESEE